MAGLVNISASQCFIDKIAVLSHLYRPKGGVLVRNGCKGAPFFPGNLPKLHEEVSSLAPKAPVSQLMHFPVNIHSASPRYSHRCLCWRIYILSPA